MKKNFFIQNSEKAFQEILFENRNKAYGAYVLRTEQNEVMQKAFLAGVSLFALLAVTPFLLQKLKQNPEKIYLSGPFVLQPIDEFPVVKKPEIPVVRVSKQAVKTQSQEVPTPVHQPAVEQPIQKRVEDAQIGLVNNLNGSNVTGHVTDHAGESSGKGESPVIKNDPNVVVSKVDVEADFAGGINVFRDKFLQGFNTEAVENSEDVLLKGVVTFVVEKDGTISNIKVAGNDVAFNKEAERTVKSIKGKWKPAQYQGEAVRSYFRFPVAMQFD